MYCLVSIICFCLFDFMLSFIYGLHWIPQSVLFLPNEEGGQVFSSSGKQSCCFPPPVFTKTTLWTKLLSVEASCMYSIEESRRFGHGSFSFLNGPKDIIYPETTLFLLWSF